MNTNDRSVARRYLVADGAGEKRSGTQDDGPGSPPNTDQSEPGEGSEESMRCRRTHDRQGVELSVVMAELSRNGEPGEPWEAVSLDLSRSGVGLRSRRMVHKGRLVLLAVAPKGNRPGRLYCGKVMQSRYAEGIGYIVGVRFEECPEGIHIDRWWNKHMKGRRAA